MLKPITIPRASLAMQQATVLRWCKQEGDVVQADEALLEIETDKVVMEVSAPEAGILHRVEVWDGLADVDAVVGWLATSDEVAANPAATAASAPSYVAVAVPGFHDTEEVSEEVETDDFNPLEISLSQLLAMYERMCLIRAFEETAIELFRKGMISGSTHPCIAQEAIAVGTMFALEDSDQILATYRGHGQCLAKGMDAAVMFAELLGRQSGCCGGNGGSMHLCDPVRGVLGTNAIVAAHIPIAGGVALASQLRGDGRITACFFGDGASCEGEFFETLNMAAVWKVPLLLVCENNEYAISVHISQSQATPNIADRARGFGIANKIVDGNDVLAVYQAVTQAAYRLRRGQGPFFLECKTVRWERHSAFSLGKAENPEAVRRWREADPIPRFATRLQNEFGFSAIQLDRAAATARAAVERASQQALAAPLATSETIRANVFAPGTDVDTF